MGKRFADGESEKVLTMWFDDCAKLELTMSFDDCAKHEVSGSFISLYYSPAGPKI